MFCVRGEINVSPSVAQFTGSEQGSDQNPLAWSENTPRDFICSGTLSQLFINPDFSPWKKKKKKKKKSWSAT